MKSIRGYILQALLFFVFSITYAQDNSAKKANTQDVDKAAYFDIRGSVFDEEGNRPIPRVSIQINGSRYTTTDANGKFTVKAKVGDELIVTHASFDPVYHTIEGNDRIYIMVQTEQFRNSKRSKSRVNEKAFNRFIDSADVYLKKDAEKSIRFVGDALNVNNSTLQSAEAHELLGDIYTYWEQFDLAISAYKISIQNYDTNATRLKLANAHLQNGDYDKSLTVYSNLDEKQLSNYNKIVRAEGLGDTHLKMKNYEAAVTAYQSGLEVASEHLISPKITDLNSKIAQAYNRKGDKGRAKSFFTNSLDLATKENKKRSVEEKLKVAEFNSENADYESEIQLRKQALEDIKDIEKDSVIPNESPITSQKQNYKIANALILQNKNEAALPYLEVSRKEAEKKGDLIVEKDATRKMAEELIKKGDTEEGLAMIENYENIVDELYAQKEQELSQVARFSRNLALQQNRITALESDRELYLSKIALSQERNKGQQFIIYSFIGGIILLLVAGFFMYKSIRQQRLANNLLALKSLRSQMNPHFIFNALNSVNSFIATNDERTANKYLTDFSFLMRSVLENSEEDFIPLKKEIELLTLYTKLEHFRFQDKFDYQINIDESINTEAFLIPPMLLQPYIENAVWHGLRYKENKGQLHIDVQFKSKNEITITITDDGIGRKRSKILKTEHQKRQKSKGMDNIKERVAILNDMYKDKVDVSINDFHSNVEDVGTKVVVTLKKD